MPIDQTESQLEPQQLARERDRSQLLLEITNAVVSNLDLADLLAAISTSLRRVVPHDFAGMTFYEADTGALRVQALDTARNREVFGTTDLIPLKGTAAGKAFTSRQTVLLRRFDPADSSIAIVRHVVAAGLKSGCYAPLISRDQALGTLDVMSFREDAFSEEDAELLTQAGQQIAIAVENALNFERARKAEQEVRRQFERERLMLEINNAVVTQLDLRELVRVISSRLREALHYEIAGLSVYHPETNQLRAYAFDLPDKQFVIPEGAPIPLTGTMGGRAFRSGQPIFINRIDPEKAGADFNQRFIDIGVKSGGCVPLIVHGRKLGVLGFGSFREDAFSEADQELLGHIANQIAIAVENALNFERAQQAKRQAAEERDRSELLLEINNAVVSHLDLKELVKTISASLRERLPHDAAGIALYEPELNHLREYTNVAYKDVDAFREGDTIPLEGTPAGEVFLTGQPMLIRRPNLAKYPADRYSQRPVEGSPKSACLALLSSHGRKLGIAGVSSTQEERFTEDDLELFCQITDQIAIAVENALNFERARRAEQESRRQFERERLMLEINNAIVSNLELRSLFLAVSASLRSAVQHDMAALTLYDAGTNQVTLYAIDSGGRERKSQVEEGTTGSLDKAPPFLRQLIVEQKPIRIDRMDRNPNSPELAMAEGLISDCSVPMILRGKTVGVLHVGSLRESAFSDSDVELLGQIAGQIGIAVENALAYREIELLKDKLAEEKLYLEEEINTAYNFEEIIGSSPALKRILKQVETVAPTDSTVLIQGETGTGKELIARAIHSLSARRDRTLVKLNCAAIPTGLLESELFGHEKGAFTGAIAQRIGRFELAHKGTMFLDEVGEIPLELQPKLLRVLQEQEFERLGNARTQRVDVRLIAATNRDLAQMAAENRFRSDLFYRLNVFPITIPPLRERPEDIPTLTRFFANKFAGRMKKQIETIPAESVAALQRYRWPGNIRELENLIERAVILTQGAELQIPLPEVNMPGMAAAVAVNSAPAPAPFTSSDPTSLEAIEREHILRILRETNWVVGGPAGAAARLGLKRTTLQNRMAKLGISRPS